MLTRTDDRLTTTEAGRLVGRSGAAVRQAINLGTLAATNVRGHWYVEREAVIAWNKRARRLTSKRPPAWERSAQLLAEYGSASPDELAVLANIHVGNARKYLAILGNLGRAERRSDGQWVLIALAEQGAA